jgi:hypothetical protein
LLYYKPDMTQNDQQGEVILQAAPIIFTAFHNDKKKSSD